MEWAQDKFAQRLEQMLLERKISQKEFAASIEMNESTFSNFKGKSKPSFSDILKISAGLNVRPEWLTFGHEFEPMDDEEVELVEDWRKMNDSERHAFTAMCHAVVQDRTELLKKPVRGKRAKPAVLQIESVALSAQLKELDRIRKSVTEAQKPLNLEEPLYAMLSTVSMRLDLLSAAVAQRSSPESLPTVDVAAAGDEAPVVHSVSQPKLPNRTRPKS